MEAGPTSRGVQILLGWRTAGKQGERARKGLLGHKVIPRESQVRSFKARVAWLWRKPTDGGPLG